MNFRGRPRREPTVYSTVVDTLNDSFDLNDGEWSLREALYWATGPGTITFAKSIAGGTILLSSRLDCYGMNIDGEQLGMTLDAQQKSHVMSTSGEVTLRGLTITGGMTYGSGGGINNAGMLTLTGCTISGNSAFGCGGIYNQGGTLTLTDCTVAENSGYYGGGIHNSSGTLTLTGCTIFGNSAKNGGGGISNAGSSSVLTLTNCTISGNSASNSGGGIYNSYNRTLTTLYNSIVVMNTAIISGNDLYQYVYNGKTGTINALNVLSSYTDWTTSESCYVYVLSKPLFVDAAGGDYRLAKDSQAIDVGNNTFAVYPDGSAILTDLAGNTRIIGGTVDLGAYEYKPLFSIVVTTLNDTVEATDGVVSLREAITALHTGGTITFDASLAGCTITLGGSPLEIEKSLTIDAGALEGGIIINADQNSRVFYITGGSSESPVSLIGLTITGGKTDGSGGGIYNSGTLTLTGCTIFGNSASGSSSRGGGIYNGYGTLTLTNCTITGNSASTRGGGICSYYGKLTLYNCIAAMNTASSENDIYGGTNNAFNVLSSYTSWTTSTSCYVFDSAKPLFVDAENGNYRLADGSQAINVGNNAYAVYPDGSAIEFDSAGKARIVGGAVDLGAYEYQGASILPLAAPVNVVVISAGANRHAVSWDAVENAFEYEVAWSADQTNWQTVRTSDLSYTVTGLTYGASMSYKVTALGDGVSCADSDWSATVNLAVCPMDINGDGRINAGDRNFLSESWNMRIGSAGCDPRSDVNGDGRVNAGDRNWLSNNWGKRNDAADLAYPEALAAASLPTSAAMDAVFDDAFESAWDDEFEFFG